LRFFHPFAGGGFLQPSANGLLHLRFAIDGFAIAGKFKRAQL
jgi:hypothetical protein